MKQIKVSVKRKKQPDTNLNSSEDEALRIVLERLRKKGLNPMQMCQKLLEHAEPAPGGQVWSYDLVVSECRRLKIQH